MRSGSERRLWKKEPSTKEDPGGPPAPMMLLARYW
jgi:hypothetical protein